MDEALRRRRFGRALRAARETAGMNQTAFAEHLSSDDRPISQSLVSRWELGQVEPEPYQVFALEASLGLPAGDLSRYLGFVPVDPADAPEPPAGKTIRVSITGGDDLARQMGQFSAIPAAEFDRLRESMAPIVEQLNRLGGIDREAMQRIVAPLVEQAAEAQKTLGPVLQQYADIQASLAPLIASTQVHTPAVITESERAAIADQEHAQKLVEAATGRPRRKTKKVSGDEPSDEA